MAYHQGRLVAFVSHQSVRAVYHHTFRCVSKMHSQWWYTTVSTVDDIHGVAVMICNSLRNWLYTMLRIDFNKNMCYNFVEKEVTYRDGSTVHSWRAMLVATRCRKMIRHSKFSNYRRDDYQSSADTISQRVVRDADPYGCLTVTDL